jgi:hypothetical protein
VLLVKAVWRWQRGEARRLGVQRLLRGGAVCFWQWFGSRLQLTPHRHVLLPEVQWSLRGEVVALPPPSDDDVRRVLERVLRQARRGWEASDSAWAEDEYEASQQQAVQQRLELPPTPTRRQRRVAVAHGFSLHADTAVAANDRQGFERLCRYLSPCQLPTSEAG